MLYNKKIIVKMLDLLNKINELNQNKYKIYDFSNHTFQQLCKCVELCQKINNIIVYIERNSENNDFFQLHENINRSESKSYINTQVIMFHKDNYIDFIEKSYSNESDKKGKRLMIMKNLLENNGCAICFEENLSLAPCHHCITSFCYECLKRHFKNKKGCICPLCKENMNIEIAFH